VVRAHRAAALVVVLGSSLARAAGPQAAPECQTDSGARLHDGFFARSDVALAFFSAIVRGSGASGRRTGIRGIGQSQGVSIGGTPDRGLVLGGSLWAARIDPVFVEDGKTIVPDDDSVKITLARVGPFLDWYPDPSRGFHTNASAAFTIQIESDAKGHAVKPAAVGAALSVGTGYDWFVSSQLSIGLLGRVAFGREIRRPLEGEQRMTWFVPELAFSATYH
jgi:hypothetical protein